MEDKLKLFVWHNVMEDYGYGVIFALARNVEEARKVAIEAYSDDWNNNNYLVEQFKKEMRDEPEIVETPKGFYLKGGS